jgi:hypothetical protein
LYTKTSSGSGWPGILTTLATKGTKEQSLRWSL